MTLNRDEGLTGASNLFFYPLNLGAPLGWPLATLLFAALALSMAQWRDRRLRPLVLFTVVAFTLLTLHPNKQDRYMFTALPVLYVLGEVQLVRLLPFSLSPARNRRVLGLGWGVILASLALFLNPAPTLEEEREVQAIYQPAREIMDFVLQSTGTGRRILVLGSGGVLPHYLLEWEITSRFGIRNPVVKLLLFPEGHTSDRYRSGYPSEMTRDYAKVLEASLRQGRFDDVVTLRMTDDSVFNPEYLKRWDVWSQNYVMAMTSTPGYAIAGERDFADCGVLVRIYRPTTSVDSR
jgi:hypothetical protein